MTSADLQKNPFGLRQQILEFLVPGLSFSITGIGILLWQRGIDLNYQYFSLGCIISSCILAYLAWIRPRRDIVSLTTPVYAFIFFLVPSDDGSWIFLQLLYGVSLTALLIRLKYRFGSTAPQPGAGIVRGPLEEYADAVVQSLPPVSGDMAVDAATVFIRFSQGDYETAARLAAAGSRNQEVPPVLGEAYAIIGEQAAHTSTEISVPDSFRNFSPEHEAFLFHKADYGRDKDQAYSTALDNALLVLYATGLSAQGERLKNALGSLRPFALRLCGLQP